MLHSPSPLLEPGPRAFARLLRVPLETGAPLFGDDVGDEGPGDGEPEPDWLRSAAIAVLDQGAVRLQVRATPSLTPRDIRAWLVRTLGEERGVLAAWPELPGLCARATERILALPGTVGAGHAWWWLWNLQRSVFSRRDSYTTVPWHGHGGGSGFAVYRLAGQPGRAFDWFPGGGSYGIKPGVVDAFLYYGLTVTVRDLETHGRAPSLGAQVEHAALAARPLLEAAANGLAPPVFAHMLVHDADEYVEMQKVLLPAQAAITREMVAQLSKELSCNVGAVVTVSQIHTFRLSDMLRAYVGMETWENRRKARSEIHAAVSDLLSKIKRLAELNTLKLNVTPDTVVFCPELADAESGEEAADDWELRGYGFSSRAFEAVKGKPFLFDFDPLMCKRLGTADGYDASVAFVLMTLLLLETTRATCGPAARHVLAEAVVDDADFARAWRTAGERAAAFSAMLSRTFVHSRVERDALGSNVFVDVGTDCCAVVRAGLRSLIDAPREAAPPPPTPPPPPPQARFRLLVTLLVGAARYDPSEPPSAGEQNVRRVTKEAVRARMVEVAAERRGRVVDAWRRSHKPQPK